MQPEISPRCSSCGAAVREPAMFCPECGKPLATDAPRSEPLAEIPGAELAPPVDSAAIKAGESQTAAASVEVPAVPAEPAANKTGQPDDGPHGVRERTREGLHRASNAARGALEDNVKRVEKIHHVSTAMLEEAHYDPSLRFVLVALGLFIVFIILLVLSKVMG
jgi:hypothetical protein